jgi:hypothetical protein
MLMLLAGSVTNYKVKADREHKRLDQQFVDGEEVIIKGPHLLIQKPERPIIMVRDPRAVISSRLGAHTANRTSDYFCGLYECNGRKGRNWGVIPLALIVMQYSDTTALGRKGLIVKYEHLVSDPDRIQRQVGAYWGLEFDRKWSEFPENWPDTYLQLWDHKLNGARPLDSGHDWKDHLPRIKEVYEKNPELQEILELLRYERNTDWLEENGITIHFSQIKEESEAVAVKTK